jgi:hypothetical protein
MTLFDFEDEDECAYCGEILCDGECEEDWDEDDGWEDEDEWDDEEDDLGFRNVL